MRAIFSVLISKSLCAISAGMNNLSRPLRMEALKVVCKNERESAFCVIEKKIKSLSRRAECVKLWITAFLLALFLFDYQSTVSFITIGLSRLTKHRRRLLIDLLVNSHSNLHAIDTPIELECLENDFRLIWVGCTMKYDTHSKYLILSAVINFEFKL